VRSEALTSADGASRVAPDRRAWLMVLALVLAGTALRLTSLVSRSMWLDEAITVDQTNRSLVGVVSNIATGVHPPLFHILMHFWVSAFGIGQAEIRSFALVWGVLSIPAAFWAGRAIYGRTTGLVAATIVAFSPYLIWYSQEARMYSMMFLFGVLSTGFYTLSVRDGRWAHWLGYTVVTFLGMFTHYFFFFLVIGQVIHFLGYEAVVAYANAAREGSGRPSFRAVLRKVPSLVPWLLSMTFLAATYALWLSKSVFMKQTEGGTALVASATGSGLGYGQKAPELAIRFNDAGLVLVEMLGGFHSGSLMYSLVAMWPVVISVVLVLMGFVNPLKKSAPVLWAASSVPLLFLLGQWQGQVLASRYFIALAAPALLLIAAVIAKTPRRVMFTIVGIGIAVSLLAWADQSYNPNNLIRYDNREAVQYVTDNFRPSDVVIYEPVYLEPLMKYYVPAEIPAYRFPQYGTFGLLRNDKRLLQQDLERVAGPSKRTWLILSFQDIAALRGDAYNTQQWFLRNGFTIAEDKKLSNVQVILFENQDYDPGFLLPGGSL
jgi:uncharacterized membrane protein